ncbi:MAG: TetR/AcrR family transcriptional regulator [Lachnospiraceae bacterium]|jgi:AcrR family transcriptional regulator|nr:TetR/AcrR family transcriptional regulator [Lachnospiraceae bacterium]
MNVKFFDLSSEKQDRMINAALMHFSINGYKHASTDDIVKSASISKGLLFHYFGSKNGLFNFLIGYSIRYICNEYERTILKETDYFEFKLKQESAKNDILRNYPYMFSFVDRFVESNEDEMDEASKESVANYFKVMENYWNRLEFPELKKDADIRVVNDLIDYASAGLTEKALRNGTVKADKLNKQICEYINYIREMTL